jgi:iron complex outermembrane recepter protein
MKWISCTAATAWMLLAAAPPPAAAMGNGTGTDPQAIAGVVRGETGEPLPRAQVTAAATGRSVLTGEDGRFVLRGLPAGRHRLEVSLLGYAPATREVVLQRGEGATDLEFTLVATPLTLPGLQVTGTPSAGLVSAATRATTQLRGAALERNLSSTLAQTLEAQPGIAVRYFGPAAAAPIVRGLTGDRILILQDGHRAADLSGSAEDHAVTIDPLTAQRIEVVRGPAALLYGNNALGGVVNVITADVPDRVPTRAEGMASFQSESAFPGGAGSLRLNLPAGEQWALALRGGARSTGDVRIARDPVLGTRLDNTDSRNWNGSVGLGYQGERVTGGASLRGFGFAYGLPMPPGEDEPVDVHGRSLAATARLEVALPGARFPALRLTGTAQDYRHDELEDGELEMAFGLRTWTADVLLRQDRVGPFREGAWGASALLRDYAATGADQLVPPADSRAFGAFGFQELPLWENGPALQLGGRLDRWRVASYEDPGFGPPVERAFTAFSGSAGFTVPLAPWVTWGVSAARSFRAPTVEELFSDAPHAGTASYEVGDATLEPEVSQGLDAVLRMNTPRLSAELAAYHNAVDHFIHFASRGDTLVDGTRWPVLAYVQDRATLTGAEGSVDWVAVPGVVAGVRGDWLRASLAGGTPLPYMPPARVAGSLRWERGTLGLGMGVRHAFPQSRIAKAGEVATGAYTLLDVDAGVRIQRAGVVHSVTLRADNLTDVLYRDAASRIKAFAPNPGRNVALTYRMLF